MSWRQRIEPVIRPLMQAWWRFSRGTTLGVRGIVADGEGRVVLVRHTYVAGWHLPGGGVEAGETAQLALERELAEEAGVAVQGGVEPVGLFANHARFRGDHVMVYRVGDWQACEPDSDGEIAETGWFDPADPPEGTSPATRRRLAEFVTGQAAAADW